VHNRRVPTHRKPGYVVFRRVGRDEWELVGEVERRRGLPARKARAQAIADAAGAEPGRDEVYAAVLSSEWRIALDY
jgi:hypothetical protein